MSSLTPNYILNRALKTHACMVVIAADTLFPWTWPDITPANFLLKHTACTGLFEARETEGADTSGQRGVRDEQLELLRVKMKQFVALGKLHFRTQPAKLRLLKPLRAHSRTVKGTLEQALKVDVAWTEVDPTYVPEAGNTCAAFHTLRLLCVAEAAAVATESAEESEAGGDLRVALDELYRLSVDWYQEALRRFGPETAHGIMIREEIPTQPAHPDGPGEATLSAGAWNSTTHIAPLTMDSEDSTVFTLQDRAVGETTWNTVLDDIAADAEGHATFDYELESGTRELRVVPRNGDGVEGEPSNVVTVNAA